MSKTPSPVSSPLPIGYWLPSVTNNQVSALTVTFSSKIVPSNLQTLHKAIEVFIASENSEKIRRALAYIIRTSGDIKYTTGDHVYYKRADSKKWHGLGTLLGQDVEKTLIKNGSCYFRVYPCRLQLIPPST